MFSSICRLLNVSLDTAIPGLSRTAPALGVELCNCPRGYAASSCQEPAVGFWMPTPSVHMTSIQGTIVIHMEGEAKPCHCNNRAMQCDPDTGDCMVSSLKEEFCPSDMEFCIHNYLDRWVCRNNAVWTLVNSRRCREDIDHDYWRTKAFKKILYSPILFYIFVSYRTAPEAQGDQDATPVQRDIMVRRTHLAAARLARAHLELLTLQTPVRWRPVEDCSVFVNLVSSVFFTSLLWPTLSSRPMSILFSIYLSITVWMLEQLKLIQST